MMSRARLLLAAVAGLAFETPGLAHTDDPAADPLTKITEGRVAGKPQRCIALTQTYSSRIVDNTAIVYRVGNIYYVNRPRSGTKSLDDNALMVVRTFGSQLCELDTIDLLDRYSRGLRGFVILGPFIPYKPAAREP